VHLNPLAPPRLEALIATALEKDRDLRHQHASDVQAELRRIRRDLDSGSLVASQSVVTAVRDISSAPPVAAARPPKTTRGREKALGAVAVVAVIAVAVLVWREQRPTQDRPVTTTAEAPVATVPPAVPANAAPPPIAGTPPVPQARQEPAPRIAPQPGPRGATPPAVVPAPASSTSADAAGRTPTPPPEVVPSQNVPSATPPAADEVKPLPSPPTAQIAAPTAPAQTVTPQPRTAAAPEPVRPAAVAPVETDDAAIRRVIRTFEQAIETKDIGLYRSVRPGLSAASEAVVRSSFKQVDSQQIDIRIESIRIDGRTATAQLVRRDTLVTAGRSQIQNSTQTMRFQKTEAGWIIAE
jgi:hypothetical protein